MGAGASRLTPEAMSAAKQLVDSAISGNKVVIFSKTYCPYCVKGKRALEKFLPKSKITVVELDGRGDGSAIQDYLMELTGGRSVPRVFIDGQFIGGGDDTDALARNGKLEIMLRDAGVL
ncbi:CPYC type [Chlorella sorokiniana]|uniref:CPYC type n=1 Tax=Chlorella sorokiniana TaxID=3076 RepID=A0A2P6TZC8_CHLSO|nr:CPYC type [Chlorella sorokiniana]|eukprot:PRW59393.1 CPYC type [Chlorella sorokiniana]